MKFSIRFLLAITLLVALSISSGIKRRQVDSLAATLSVIKRDYKRLDAQAEFRRPATAVAKDVLERYRMTSPVYRAAKQRYKLLREQRAAE